MFFEVAESPSILSSSKTFSVCDSGELSDGDSVEINMTESFLIELCVHCQSEFSTFRYTLTQFSSCFLILYTVMGPQLLEKYIH